MPDLAGTKKHKNDCKTHVASNTTFPQRRSLENIPNLAIPKKQRTIQDSRYIKHTTSPKNRIPNNQTTLRTFRTSQFKQKTVKTSEPSTTIHKQTLPRSTHHQEHLSMNACPNTKHDPHTYTCHQTHDKWTPSKLTHPKEIYFQESANT